MHLLVCNTQWIFKMHGATIKIISAQQTKLNVYKNTNLKLLQKYIIYNWCIRWCVILSELLFSVVLLHSTWHVSTHLVHHCGLSQFVQWKPLTMITSGSALFGNNNQLITLSGGATWCTIIYQYSSIGEFLPLMEMRCVRPLPFLMTSQS